MKRPALWSAIRSSGLTAIALALMLASPVLGGTTVVEGETGQGALYRFHVPDGLDGDLWNGDVVYWAIGYVLPSNEPSLIPPVTNGPDGLFLDPLLERGYAVAYSSYSSTGMAIKEGMQDTHQLRGLFAAEFGKPRRSYLAGMSMGGLIVLGLAEKYASQYDGVLSICGLYAGTHATIDYIWGFRPIFDHYYPGVLPGDAFDVPKNYDFFGEGLPAILTAVLGDLESAQEIASVDQLDISYDSVTELLDNFIWRLLFVMLGTHDLADRTHGHIPFDNVDVYYTGTSDDVALNAGIDRFMSRRDAENHWNHYYEPTGRLRVPVLTLHNTRDPAMPIESQADLDATVAAHGAGDLLVHQWVDRAGHCNMSKQEVMTSFDDLVSWVEDGVAPPAGDITLP